MYSVYKKFTAQDYATVPFNAHKQYIFNSASAADSKITYHDTRWTSESIDIYSTGSESLSGDTINTIRYNQIDHLFYRNFKKDLTNRFGDWHYLNQKRVLYEEANILSIPTGLYGHEIKKGSFFLSSSGFKFIDDQKGHLILSGTSLSDYVTDVRKNVLNIGPVNGFKRYDLNTYEGYVKLDGWKDTIYWRDGKPKVQLLTYYNTHDFGDEFDDSYFFNKIKYTDVSFSKEYLFSGSYVSGGYQHRFPSINLNGSSSEIKLANDEKFHFNYKDDFTIAFWADLPIQSRLDKGDAVYLIAKSTTQTIVPTPTAKRALNVNTNFSGALQPLDVPSAPQYPFEVYVQNESGSLAQPHIYFKRSDGDTITMISASVVTNSGDVFGYMHHYACLYSASQMKLYVDGMPTGSSGSDGSVKQTQNNANLYIGNKGGSTNHMSGSLSQINIYDDALTDTQILNHYSSSNGSPYIGNIFYTHGLATITHPGYQSIFNDDAIPDMIIEDTFIVGGSPEYFFGITGEQGLKFQGSHLIYEHEYQCTVDEHEYNDTTNISARKIKTIQGEEVADFTTSSLFRPYVTTVGLYNEDNELLVVGKLGQPIRMSDETDTTFVLRWDT